MKQLCAYADLKLVLQPYNTAVSVQKPTQPAIGSCWVQVSARTFVVGFVRKEAGRQCLLARENSKAVSPQAVHLNLGLFLELNVSVSICYFAEARKKAQVENSVGTDLLFRK